MMTRMAVSRCCCIDCDTGSYSDTFSSPTIESGWQIGDPDNWSINTTTDRLQNLDTIASKIQRCGIVSSHTNLVITLEVDLWANDPGNFAQMHIVLSFTTGFLTPSWGFRRRASDYFAIDPANPIGQIISGVTPADGDTLTMVITNTSGNSFDTDYKVNGTTKLSTSGSTYTFTPEFVYGFSSFTFSGSYDYEFDNFDLTITN